MRVSQDEDLRRGCDPLEVVEARERLCLRQHVLLGIDHGALMQRDALHRRAGRQVLQQRSNVGFEQLARPAKAGLRAAVGGLP